MKLFIISLLVLVSVDLTIYSMQKVSSLQILADTLHIEILTDLIKDKQYSMLLDRIKESKSQLPLQNKLIASLYFKQLATMYSNDLRDFFSEYSTQLQLDNDEFALLLQQYPTKQLVNVDYKLLPEYTNSLVKFQQNEHDISLDRKLNKVIIGLKMRTMISYAKQDIAISKKTTHLANINDIMQEFTADIQKNSTEQQNQLETSLYDTKQLVESVVKTKAECHELEKRKNILAKLIENLKHEVNAIISFKTKADVLIDDTADGDHDIKNLLQNDLHTLVCDQETKQIELDYTNQILENVEAKLHTDQQTLSDKIAILTLKDEKITDKRASLNRRKNLLHSQENMLLINEVNLKKDLDKIKKELEENNLKLLQIKKCNELLFKEEQELLCREERGKESSLIRGKINTEHMLQQGKLQENLMRYQETQNLTLISKR